MKKTILAGAVLAALGASVNVAYAEDAAAQPEHNVTYNLGATSDYVFRGISQSRNKPAVSGGVDYSHTPSGLYLGAWASTISWIADSHPDGATTRARSSTPFELDLYGGVKGDIGNGFSYDAGGIYYFYPNHNLGSKPDANTFEVYGKLAYGPAYLKVNYALTDAFYFADKAGTYYLDFGGDFPLMEGLTANLHYGMFRFKNGGNAPTASAADYEDWKVGLTKDFGGGLSGSIAATGTNANKAVWNFNNTGYLGDTKGIVTLTKAF